MSARLAVHLPPHQLPELQRATRALLRSPLLTAKDDEFRLVLRWETVLRNEFGQKLGYRLDVSRSAARLLRRPASTTETRGAFIERNGRHLGRWGYVYLCLTLAALEQPGHQVVASELLGRITNLARGDERLALDTTEYSQRRAFRDAVRYLEQVGVLAVRDGDVESLLQEGEVLWDVDRDAAAMCMVATPSILRSVSSVEDFVAEPLPSGIEARRRRARHLLNRRMLDQPVVATADLNGDELELAWRNRRREAENISRLTGCEIELRREGIALIEHPVHPMGRSRFPGSDNVSHAALLWLTELLHRAEPTGPAEPFDHVDADGMTTEDSVELDAPPVVETPTADREVPAADVDAAWTVVLEQYGERLGKDAREQPDRVRTAAESVLRRFGLVEPGPQRWRVRAVANRYRAEPLSSAADAEDDLTDPAEQQAMF
jgi:uncharacterized protein (TIGR02678 family)